MRKASFFDPPAARTHARINSNLFFLGHSTTHKNVELLFFDSYLLKNLIFNMLKNAQNIYTTSQFLLKFAQKM
jgi:hypothetical protein